VAHPSSDIKGHREQGQYGHNPGEGLDRETEGEPLVPSQQEADVLDDDELDFDDDDDDFDDDVVELEDDDEDVTDEEAERADGS